ncbi:Glycosyltransferase [Rhynchospora pubera]|uniref:Glycosyltransferase n=1 Tax=Rhynchospora pubera TaxID=906938 RepID=A0AAV8GL37_9POAL|nr:Glycosyltransferase [Rhynchospora pubera]
MVQGERSELKESNMKSAVVLYSNPAAGHLIPMVSLAKLFEEHGFSATVITFNHPLITNKADQEVSLLSAANLSISFHVLPPITTGEDSYANLPPPDVSRIILEAQNQNLQNFILDLSKTCCVRVMVLDYLCTLALDAARQLSIPAYFLTPFSASFAAFLLNLLELDVSSSLSLKDFGDGPINFPGLPPVLTSDCLIYLIDRETDSYKAFMRTVPSLVKSDGILINTFESLEPKAISALREGLCVPSFNMPPVYSIGPLVTETREKELEERHECLKWLDSQPKGTVVFLCFGSMGGFPLDQIKQIAIGLENSGQRFLWVIKVFVNLDPKKIFNTSIPEFEMDQILPEGFLDRTKDRGMIVKTWAPQIQVLHHESVGAFVTHCGWNSILEAVTAGKPMVCWPLYAEQRLNKAVLVDHETRLGVSVEGYDHEMVDAEEVESKIRWLMEGEGSKFLKERIEAMKDKASESLTETGSSSQAFVQFLIDLERQTLSKTKI